MWCRRMWRQNVASPAHVWSPDVASERGVTCSKWQGATLRCRTWLQNVASLAHVALRSPEVVPTNRRCLPTWRQGAIWHWRPWRQNVTSLAQAASGSHVALLGRGVRTWRQVPMWRQGAAACTWRHQRGMSSTEQVLPPGTSDAPELTLCDRRSRQLPQCGVKTWRHLLTRRRRRTWRLNLSMASGAIDPRGVSTCVMGPGHSQQVSSECVFSRRAIWAPPQANPLEV